MFKGGTCLKKCYFETYRFSEALDFTFRDDAHLDVGLLRRVLDEVIALPRVHVTAQSSGQSTPPKAGLVPTVRLAWPHWPRTHAGAWLAKYRRNQRRRKSLPRNDPKPGTG